MLGRDPFLRVWDVSDDRDEVKEVWKARVQRGQKVRSRSVPTASYLTAVSTGQLLVFDAADSKENDEIRKPLIQLERYSDNGPIHHAAFSPDSRLLIVGTGHVRSRRSVGSGDARARRDIHHWLRRDVADVRVP